MVTFCALEGFWRMKGYVPSVNDDAAFWAMTRLDLDDVIDEEPILLVGTSRTQTDCNIDVLEQEFGKKPISLAVVCSTVVPVMENLARETSFNGTVICEYAPEMIFFDDSEQDTNTDRVLNALDRMKKEIFGSLEKRFIVFFQGRFAFLNNQLTFEDQVRAVAKRELPEAANTYRPDRARFLDDRSRTPYPDFEIPEELPDSVEVTPFGRDALDRLILSARTIIENGGRVIFVTHPSRGEHYFLELTEYPRNSFWFPLLEGSGALGIHKFENPILVKELPLVDYVHLNFIQAEQYSHDLGRLIMESLDVNSEL
ncbi:hypothetical protein N9059_01695 [bacterium]|nr:hypothetical protein [bacterium]